MLSELSTATMMSAFPPSRFSASWETWVHAASARAPPMVGLATPISPGAAVPPEGSEEEPEGAPPPLDPLPPPAELPKRVAPLPSPEHAATPSKTTQCHLRMMKNLRPTGRNYARSRVFYKDKF